MSYQLQIEREHFENEKQNFEAEKDDIRDELERLRQENLKLTSQKNILKEKYDSLKRNIQQNQNPSDQYRGLASTSNNTKSKQNLDAMDYSPRNETSSPEYIENNPNNEIIPGFFNNHQIEVEYDNEDEHMNEFVNFNQNMNINQMKDNKQGNIRGNNNYKMNQAQVNQQDSVYYSDDQNEYEQNLNSRQKDFSLGQKQFIQEKQYQHEQYNRQQEMDNYHNQNMNNNYYEIGNQRNQMGYMGNNQQMMGLPRAGVQEHNQDAQMIYGSYYQNPYMQIPYQEASFTKEQNMPSQIVSGNSTDRYNRPRNYKMPQNYIGK